MVAQCLNKTFSPGISLRIEPPVITVAEMEVRPVTGVQIVESVGNEELRAHVCAGAAPTISTPANRL